MRYFDISEFDSPDAPGSGVNMNTQFLRILDAARESAGLPFAITSGYRTPEHNERVGGVRNSAHTRGYAADIVARTPAIAMRIITALYEQGVQRFGYYHKQGFVHADVDPDKAAPAFWDDGD